MKHSMFSKYYWHFYILLTVEIKIIFIDDTPFALYHFSVVSEFRFRITLITWITLSGKKPVPDFHHRLENDFKKKIIGIILFVFG